MSKKDDDTLRIELGQGCGCIMVAVAIAILVWAFSGFPGLAQ